MAKAAKDFDLSVYESFGLDFTDDRAGKNGMSDCPFCDKEGHFSVNKKTGQYRCLKCGDTGNSFSFLQKMHSRAYGNTKPKDWKALGEAWGNDWKFLRDHNLAYDEDKATWLIPVANGHGSVSNLMRWVVPEDGEKSPLLSTGGCELHLHFAEDIKPTGAILICEGFKDGLSLKELLAAAEDKDHSVVAVPGADVFKPEWVKQFKGRDVVLLYDNDTAGNRGMDKVLKLLTGVARSIRRITWPKGTRDKYDVRDYINDTTGTAINVWKGFQKLFTSGKIVTRLTRSSFKQVVADFKKVIRVDSHFEDAMAIAFATVFANKIPGDPIWMLLVGPPGCLTGDTIVEINRAGISSKQRLDKVVNSFNGGCDNGHYWRPDVETRIRARSSDGYIRLVPLVAAVNSGQQEVYLLRTKSGKEIKATKKHLFLTSKGWKPLSRLKPGHLVFIDGGLQPVTERKRKGQYLQIQGLKHHPFARKKSRNIFCVSRHRLVVEAYNNGLELVDYVHRLRTGESVEGLKFLPEDCIVHHKDENHRNNTLGNLEVLDSAVEHSKRHGEEGAWKHVTAQTVLDEIDSIDSAGIEPTYDLTIGDENHNFLANGIVVHNSGKSLLLKAFGSAETECEFISKLTATSFVSGFQTSDGTDLSLLARIQNKTLVIKDLTCIKSMPKDVQEALYGMLRDASDGRVDVPYGNQAPKVYKGVWFSILGGVTDIIHGDNRSVMGERFLKLEFIDGANTDREAIIRAALHNETASDPEQENLLLDSVAAFLASRTVDLKKLPKETKDFENRIVALAQVVSYLRARVQREGGDLLYRPDREIGSRPAVQLMRLAKLLAFVYDSKLDDRVYNLVRRVAVDTCTGWSLEITSALLDSLATRKPGLLTQQIAARISVTSDFARKVLVDMMELGSVRRELEEQPDGTSSYRYFASDDLIVQWNKSGLDKVRNLILVHHQPPRNKPRGKYASTRKPSKSRELGKPPRKPKHVRASSKRSGSRSA